MVHVKKSTQRRRGSNNNSIGSKYLVCSLRFSIFILRFTTLFCGIGLCQAQMQFLPLTNSSAFGAVFPCSAARKSVNSAVGVTNALQCRVDNGSSVCIFLTAEQPLDVQSFNRDGWRFLEEVNHQYALQMDKNYKKVDGKVVEIGGLGKAYAYELIRNADGVQVNVKGLWLVARGRMLRGAVSCAPNDTNYMRGESDLFLRSFLVTN
jgi:hypothetical protein